MVQRTVSSSQWYEITSWRYGKRRFNRPCQWRIGTGEDGFDESDVWTEMAQGILSIIKNTTKIGYNVLKPEIKWS